MRLKLIPLSLCASTALRAARSGREELIGERRDKVYVVVSLL
jgi:hypothetical protein